jgi:hypothetical protein
VATGFVGLNQLGLSRLVNTNEIGYWKKTEKIETCVPSFAGYYQSTGLSHLTAEIVSSYFFYLNEKEFDHFAIC